MSAAGRGVDVVVVGAGPAGRALTHRLLEHGCTVTLVDPRPEAPWRSTFACWTDELPDWVGPETIAAEVDSVVMRDATPVTVRRGYAVFDTAALQTSLGIAGARVVADRASVVSTDRVILRSGEQIDAGLVVDARGTTGRGPRQTAYGVVVAQDQAAPLLDGADAVLMDWSPATGTDPTAPPSFLYVIPLDEHRVLLEETCLAGDPAIAVAELRTRLEARLAGRRFDVLDDETVSFGLLGPTHTPWRADPLLFGARGGLMHPATGYSVAASLRAADILADAVAAQHDPRRALWPQTVRQIYRLRTAGLRSLLALDAVETRRFFDAFARLPAARQRAYLSTPDDLPAVLRTMTELFTEVGTRTRLSLMRSVLPG